MKQEKCVVKYLNIDSHNRPIFKDNKGNYYGSTEKLFPYETTEKTVLETVNASDLTFFGRKFDCEPMGTIVANIEITSEEESKFKFGQLVESHDHCIRGLVVFDENGDEHVAHYRKDEVELIKIDHHCADWKIVSEITHEYTRNPNWPGPATYS